MIRRSKYYRASESWTKRPAWAFEIPITFLESSPDGEVTLRCETGPSTGEYQELKIPCAYLKQQMDELWIRSDHETISLFLSADKSDKYVDRRGSSRVRFSQFCTAS